MLMTRVIRRGHVAVAFGHSTPWSTLYWPQLCLSPPNLQTLLYRRVEKLQAIQSVTRQGSTDTRGDVAKRVCQRPFLGLSPAGVHVRMDIVLKYVE